MGKAYVRGGDVNDEATRDHSVWRSPQRVGTLTVLLIAAGLALAQAPSFGWRTLHVERDTMDNVIEPNCMVFGSAYGAAALTIEFDTEEDNDGSEGHPYCTYDANLTYSYPDYEMLTYMNAYKGETSRDEYWCVFISSARCGPPESDYSPTSEPAMLGVTVGNEYSFVFHETIRRWVVVHPLPTALTARKRVAVHETGHQFDPALADTSHACVMTSNTVPPTQYFCEDDTEPKSSCLDYVKSPPGGHPGP